MKVLICASGNTGRLSPFVQEQAESLIILGIQVDYFLISGKGILGYLKNYSSFLKMIKDKKVKPNLSKKYKLEEASEAHKDLESRKTFGSLVLKP